MSKRHRSSSPLLPIALVCGIALIQPSLAEAFHLSASLGGSAISRGKRPGPSFFAGPHAPAEVKAKGWPVVWTIAGSDSGGGAGIQADLHAFQAFGCHGCSVITALTAQNSHEVRGVQMTPLPHLRATLAALRDDLPPRAIKIGMLGTAEVAEEVGMFLAAYEGRGPVVCDPVMVTTSGSRLLDEAGRSILVDRVMPHATLVTPNKHEAELLVGYPLSSAADYERAARDLLALGRCKAVLLKGGHHEGGEAVVQDYLLDGATGKGLWLTGPRHEGDNSHGSGCSLSSSIAALLGQGHALADAVVLAKAYVSQGIGESSPVGKGAGPVRHTSWPDSPYDFPWVTDSAELGASARPGPFPACERAMGLYPCVDSAEWVGRLLRMGVKDIQLRIKDAPPRALEKEVERASEACRRAGGRLWVNDHWQLAVQHGAYGLHVGQEDLVDLLAPVCRAGVRLGVSTHTFEELGRALALRPSYISLGPIFPTTSKEVKYPPQGYERVGQWRRVVSQPLVVIGGVDLAKAEGCVEQGADGICVVSAVTKAPDLQEAVTAWQRVFVHPSSSSAAAAASS